jgi:hypothetical protein
VNFTLPTTDAPDPAGAGFAAPDAPFAAKMLVLHAARIAKLRIIFNLGWVFMRVNSSTGVDVFVSAPALLKAALTAADLREPWGDLFDRS